MVREEIIALCAGSLMVATWTGFGWLLTPETAEFKLAKFRAGVNFSIAVRTLPPDPKAVRCMMVWVGSLGEPELWCPAAPPLPEPVAPPVPTS